MLDGYAGPSGQGQWDLEQVRKHNKVNEIDTDDDHLPDPIDPDAITEGQGQTAWIVPGYDAAGNIDNSGDTILNSVDRWHGGW